MVTHSSNLLKCLGSLAELDALERGIVRLCGFLFLVRADRGLRRVELDLELALVLLPEVLALIVLGSFLLGGGGPRPSSRCGAVLEPQQVVPALQPRTDKWLVTSAVTTENIRAAGYENQQKLDAAINAVLTKAGFDAASSTRFFAQVNSTIGILPNDRYPEEGVAGMVKQPEATRNKNCTFYAVQVLTADSHGHNAGDVVVTPLTVTKEGISLTLCTEAVVAIAWKVNE